MQGRIPSHRGIAGWFVAGLAGAILASVVGSRATVAARAGGPEYGPWADPVNVQSIPGTDPEFNTVFNDGCPTLAPDGRTLFMASNRTGTLGGQDIWIATRENPEDPWGAPVNVGEPVNSIYDDFCPSPIGITTTPRTTAW